MSTLTLTPQQNTEQKLTTVVPPVEAFSASDRAADARAPVFVPRGQLYYWSRQWQAAEAAALTDIAEGKIHRFASGSEAAAWLLSDDED